MAAPGTERRDVEVLCKFSEEQQPVVFSGDATGEKAGCQKTGGRE